MSKSPLKLEDDLQHVLKYTTGVWEAISGKTIFLTGGTGFFGRWLLETFLYANERLVSDTKLIILSRDPGAFLDQYPRYKNNNFLFVRGDVRSFEFPEGSIDYIIHAAVEINATLNQQQPTLMYETIVDGTRRVLELARVKNVKAILHTSSGSVYGKQPYDMTHIPEDFNGSPDIFDKSASLGEGKRVAEMLSSIYFNAYGVNSKIARCFAFIGPHTHLDVHFALGNFISDVISGRDIVIKGDGTPYRSYLYASDLMIWLLNILVFGESCRPYNVGSSEDVTIKQLAELVASCSAAKTGVEVALPVGNQPPARYVPDVSRVQKELNLEVRVGLKEAVEKTLKFYLETVA